MNEITSERPGLGTDQVADMFVVERLLPAQPSGRLARPTPRVCVCVNYIILLISNKPEGAGPGNYYTGISST